MKMHADQVEITADVVGRLVGIQFPQWRELPLYEVTSYGTVNSLFRLGDEMVLRFPLRPRSDTATREHFIDEMNLLRFFAEHLPLEIPAPIALGEPGEGYDGIWTVYRWIIGETLNPKSIRDFGHFASSLAHFVGALHRIETGGRTWDGQSRGGPLHLRDKAVRNALTQSAALTDTARLAQIWDVCLNAPVHDGNDVWLHADLMPGNILMREGRIAAVIDFEMACVGDPAVDLMPAWNLMPPVARDIYRRSLNISDATWDRGRGWALSQAIIALPYYVNTNPAMAHTALQTLNAILGSMPRFP